MWKMLKKSRAEAKKACHVAAKFGVTDLTVEAYDIVLIQQLEEWELIGKANCKKL